MLLYIHFSEAQVQQTVLPRLVSKFILYFMYVDSNLPCKTEWEWKQLLYTRRARLVYISLYFASLLSDKI